jgi:two-component system, NtrC family, sensor kinase
MIEVADTGMGIAPENVAKIYDPFYTTKGVGRGTGLGLAVSYGIVQEHSGQISVDSTPGRGTTFRITLPTANGRARLQAVGD